MTVALASRYDELFFAGGALAPGTAVTVRLPGTATPAALYTSPAKTTGAANPVTVDADGNLRFYADPGFYDFWALGVTLAGVPVGANPNDVAIQSRTTPQIFVGDVGFKSGRPWFDVTAFGAVADGAAAANKTAFLAAIAAANASARGGTVFLPPGQFDVGDLAILLPEFGSGKHINLVGAGREQTRLVFSVDRGADTYAISGSGARETGNYFSLIADMRIIGPGPRPETMGTSPADMHGIRWDRGTIIERVHIVGFRAAVESDANHCVMRDCTISDNFYGVYFTTDTYSGDITIDNCDLGGNLMASIGVSSAGLATFCMIKGHMGFSPYGIYIESGAGAGLSVGGTFFLGTSWEFMGNGAIVSEGQTGRIDGLLMEGCGIFQASAVTYKIAAQPHDAHIKVATLLNTSLRNVNMNGVPASAWIDVSTDINQFYWQGWQASHNIAVANAKPFILGPALVIRRNVVLDQGGSMYAVALPNSAFFAVSAGQLLEMRDLGTVQPYGSQGAALKGMLIGVALNAAATSSREWVLVAKRGFDVTCQSDSACLVTDVLVPSTANPAKVVGLASDGTTATVTKPIVGRPYVATGAAGTVRAHIQFP